MKQFHIRGLDTLRGFAALSVVIGHIEQAKYINNIPNFYGRSLFTSGHEGVILFYVISGFLITLFLLEEKSELGRIDFKKFYIRRILRIWPLYYLILILSALIFNYVPDLLTLLLCISILPNVAHAINAGWTASPQIWTIGVEEQFYLAWPVIINCFRKKLLLVLITIFVFFTILPHILIILIYKFYPNPELMDYVGKFFYGTKFNVLALGGILAFLYINKPDLINKLCSKTIAIVSLILTLILLIEKNKIKYFSDEIFALIFCLLIINFSIGNKITFNIDSKLTIFLGKISYGIYMFHWIIIYLIIKLVQPLFPESMIMGNLLLYICSIGATIIIASLSFKYYESLFLKLKDRYFNSLKNPVNDILNPELTKTKVRY